MSEDKQEGQKTIVSFIVGLLIGGLLVWAFSGPEVNAPSKDKNDNKAEEAMETESDEEVEDNEDETTDVVVETPVLSVGEGKVDVSNQAAGTSVALESATYPVSEGWIGVRDYTDGRLGGLLGVVRFSEEQGLVPSEVVLQRATIAGKEYAVVVYTESGDRQFSLANDVQLDSVFATFTAQ